MLRFFKRVMEAGITLALKSEEINGTSCNSITFYVIFGPNTSAGAVQVESSPVAGYAGTWVAEGTAMAWSAVDKVHKVTITGPVGVVRARISTAIAGGGSVDVYAIGNS